MVYKAKLEEKNANTPVKNTVAPMPMYLLRSDGHRSNKDSSTPEQNKKKFCSCFIAGFNNPKWPGNIGDWSIFSTIRSVLSKSAPDACAHRAAIEHGLIEELLFHDFAIAHFIHGDFIHLHATLAFDRYIFDQPSHLRHIPILYLAVILFQLPLEASPKS